MVVTFRPLLMCRCCIRMHRQEITLARRAAKTEPQKKQFIKAAQAGVDSRRVVERYTVNLFTVFSWITGERQAQAAEGITRDVSSIGLYIMASTVPPLDSQMWFEIRLPEIGTKSPELRIRGEGEVCRVEMSEDANGFAVHSKKLRVNRVRQKDWVV
jgi:hypothetical protein